MHRAPIVGVAIAALASACAGERSAPTGSAPAASASASAAAIASSDLESSDAGAVANDAAVGENADAAPSDGPFVATKQLVSYIYEKPQHDSQHVGVLRVGSRLKRGAEPASPLGCNGPSAKWYAVEPYGYVCNGLEGVTLDADDPAVVLASNYPPKTSEPFPYAYGTSFGTPLYVRLPTPAEQKKIEGNVASHVEAMAAMRAKLSPKKQWPETAMPASDVPEVLRDHGQSPAIVDGRDIKPIPKDAVVAGRGWPDMRLSLLALFDDESVRGEDGKPRPFYLTSEHFLVPYDRIRPARLADFHGVELAKPDAEGEHLPLAWINWKPATIYVYDDAKKIARPTKELLDFQAHVAIKDTPVVLGGVKFHELVAPPPGVENQGDGARYLVRDGQAQRMDAAKELPPGVGAKDAWIDISISAQTLVLYEGLTPVYGTLVSSGVDGANDPETTKSTPRGLYRIRSKHITSRMAGDERAPAKEGDKPDARYRVDDVPYVQFFHAGYAIHGAFWHDAFGQPKSHGCVNVSPRDALYLFGHTAPAVPKGWHAVYAGVGAAEPGTWVRIRAF